MSDRFSQMHDDYLDPDNWVNRDMNEDEEENNKDGNNDDTPTEEKQINNLKELFCTGGLDLYYKKIKPLRSHEKFVTCGTWIKKTDVGFEIKPIIDDVDEDCIPKAQELIYPFTLKQFEDKIIIIETQLLELWNDTHGCPQCQSNKYDDSVNPHCESCGGKGSSTGE